MPDDDVRGPAQRFLDEAWEKHPQRDLLDEFSRERDENGRKTRRAGFKIADDEWIEYWLEPVNSADERVPIRIGTWPRKRETDAVADEQAIADEHHVD